MSLASTLDVPTTTAAMKGMAVEKRILNDIKVG
jgi:hypothetical protein